jgi:tetratricopeptide (TPR) repeat protein
VALDGRSTLLGAHDRGPRRRAAILRGSVPSKTAGGGVAELDLGQLLAIGERAAFHGPPAQAVQALEQAVGVARDSGRSAEATAASWLLGLSLNASGRYGHALEVLTPLLAAGEQSGAAPEVRLFAALAGATLGSVHRQLGMHDAARTMDERGLALTDGTGEPAFACTIGLAADAVGLGDSETAHERADTAAVLLPDRPTEWWRQRVHYDWVRTEIGLLDEDADAAVDAADSAVERAERARAPRHVAKSLLFLGVAQVQLGQDDGAGSLRRAATLAEGLGALPLVWPARALLGALLIGQDDAESAASLAAARTAVLTIAGNLPADLRETWLSRPDLAALLEG